MANTKTTKKSTSAKSASKRTAKSAKADKQKQMEADARARVAKLRAAEAEEIQDNRGRKIAFIISIFLNLTFLVTIYAILCSK